MRFQCHGRASQARLLPAVAASWPSWANSYTANATQPSRTWTSARMCCRFWTTAKKSLVYRSRPHPDCGTRREVARAPISWMARHLNGDLGEEVTDDALFLR